MAAVLNFEGKEQALKSAFEKPKFNYTAAPHTALNTETLKKNNILIRADNFEVLKTFASLKAKFHIIYIDPPYNSGSKLTYKDSLDDDAWLCMMLPRLVLAHKILHTKGVLFISIDDRENANLTVLLREIFGNENHIGTIKWRKKRKPSFLDKHIASVIEYVLVFSKDKTELAKLCGKFSTEMTRPVLNASNAITERILKKGTKAKCRDGSYPKGSYLNKTLRFTTLQDAHIKNGFLMNEVVVHGPFRISQAVLESSIFITKKFGLRRNIVAEEQVARHATDDATHDFETNEDGQVQLKKIFAGTKVFDFPKPVGLIKNLIKMYQLKNAPIAEKSKINCLDFFAGSGTLAQAVHELNIEAKNNEYTFCCIQNEEKIKKELQDKNLQTVADITERRIKVIEKQFNIHTTCKIFKTKL